MSFRSLESGGDSGRPPKGCNLSGKRTDGARRDTASSPFFVRDRGSAERAKEPHRFTPLHRAAGARMVDFGGWDMPVHYGSQIDEHHAVRSDAGMFDVSHMRVVDVDGRRRARLPALCARQQRRQAERARQGAVLVPAHGRRRRARRPDRLFPARRFLPPGRQRRHGGQGHRVARELVAERARTASRSRRARISR